MYLYLELSSWSMFDCNLANQEKNCNTEHMHIVVGAEETSAGTAMCLLYRVPSHLLCSLDPVTLHIKHLEALEQDVLCRGGDGRCEGGLQRPGRETTQVLNGELQNKTQTHS